MVASTSLVKRDDGATLAQANNGAITTTSTALSDTNMQLCYLASELGEALTVEAGCTTVHSKLAINGATVLSPGTADGGEGALREHR